MGNIDWRDLNLNNDEIEMLESIESGEWKSVGNIEERQRNLRNFFNQGKISGNTISITIKNDDFDKIVSKSQQYGLDYKELIEKLIHDFAIGKVFL